MFWNNKNRQTTPKSQKHSDFYPGIPLLPSRCSMETDILSPYAYGQKNPGHSAMPGKISQKKMFMPLHVPRMNRREYPPRWFHPD